jgi:hypothetical protein
MARTPSEIIEELRRLQKLVDGMTRSLSPHFDHETFRDGSDVMRDAADLIEKFTTVKPCTCPNPPHDKIVPHNALCSQKFYHEQPCTGVRTPNEGTP